MITIKSRDAEILIYREKEVSSEIKERCIIYTEYMNKTYLSMQLDEEIIYIIHLWHGGARMLSTYDLYPIIIQHFINSEED